MKKTLALALGLSLLTSLYAMPQKHCGKNSCATQQCTMQIKHKKNKHMAYGMKRGRSHKDGALMGIMNLDLTQEQKTKIETILKEHKNTAPKMSAAFGKEGFDKALFIKNAEQKNMQKLQRKADLIAKIYATLTPAQKEALVAKMNR